MGAARKAGIVDDWAMVDSGPLITLRKAKATIESTTAVPVSQQLVYVVVNTPGYSDKKVPGFAWPSCPETATKEFPESHYPCNGEGTRFVFPVNEACFGRNDRSVHGYSR